MDEKIKEIWHKIQEFFTKLSIKTKRLLAAGLIAILAVAAVLAVVVANNPYTVLFTGMTQEDVSSVISYLDGAGVTDYKVEGSDTILVPESQEASLKAKLLMEGYPSSGFGYATYLEHVGSLSTESDRRTMYLFDLQDRLSSVVRCFDGVKDAAVTIAQGKDDSYVLKRDDGIQASASVLVTMKGALQLTSQQAAAIQNLICSSVQGLVIDNISIADTAGNTYGDGNSGGDTAASKLKFELEEQVNESVRANILEVLAPLFGPQNISIGVKSTVDVGRTYLDSTTYEEPAWAADGSTGGEGIIGSKIYDDSVIKGNGPAGGAAGADSNADLPSYVEQYKPNGTENQLGASGEIKYNVDTHRTQRETPAGVIKDVMVSISINSDTAGDVNTRQLVGHVARAAGIGPDVQDDKISILASPFFTGENEQGRGEKMGLSNWLIYVLAGLAGLAALLLLIIFVLRMRRGGWRRSQNAPAYAVPVTVPQTGADIMEVHTERSMELRKGVRQFAEDNPEIAAQMVKSWLKGGEDNHG